MRDFFSKQDKKALRSASRQAILDYFQEQPHCIRGQKWINKTNKYRLDCTRVFEADARKNPVAVDDKALKSYVAGTAPTHTIDGWSFLGRAMGAALRGDVYSAIHFAYYAELRAAMALLASVGIGVLNKVHPIFGVGSASQRIPGNKKDRSKATHRVMWPLLDHWCGLQSSADLFERLVSPDGINLSEWLSETNVPTPTRALAKSWMRSWGADLRTLDSDHNNRNFVSYRPSEYRSPEPVEVNEVVAFVEEAWRLLEPAQGLMSGRFVRLEQQLLKKVRDRLAPSRIVTPTQLETLGLTTMRAQQWAGFLNDETSSSVLEYSGLRLSLEAKGSHLAILARALLLLYLASSSTRYILADSGYALSDFDFWWRRFGSERGAWPAGREPDHPHDAWADIASLIARSEEWRATTVAGDISVHQWRSDVPQVWVGFEGFELAGIWALLP